jgi:hypothetical protein
MTNAAAVGASCREDNIKMAAVRRRCQPPVLIIAPERARRRREGCERGKDASAKKYNAQDYFIFKGALPRTARGEGGKREPGEVMLPPPLQIWTFEACF